MLINRTDRTGLLANILLTLLITALANAVIFGFGWQNTGSQQPVLPDVPPGWAIGLIWLVLLSMQATLRWKLVCGGHGIAARWVTANILIAIGYPFYTAGLQFVPGVIFSGITFGIGLSVAARVFEANRKALVLMLPTLAWSAYVNIAGMRALLAYLY